MNRGQKEPEEGKQVYQDDRHEETFRSFRFEMLPTYANDTPFCRRDCRESIFAFGSQFARAIRCPFLEPLAQPWTRSQMKIYF